jgi:hypothetical protein
MTGPVTIQRIAERCTIETAELILGMKLAGDANAKREIGDDAPIEELKKLFEMHLMNLAPVLDLNILPLDGDDDLEEAEPGDEIGDCDAPQGRAGNDAGAPQGRRRCQGPP